MRKSNWAKLKWPRVKETAPPAPLWLFCDPFCKSRGQSTCMGELIQKKTRVATIFQWAETHQTFRSRLWVLTNLVSVSETNPNKKQILRRAMLVYSKDQIKEKKSQDVQDNGSKTSSCSVGQRMPKVVRFKLLVPVIQIGSVIVRLFQRSPTFSGLFLSLDNA